MKKTYIVLSFALIAHLSCTMDKSHKINIEIKTLKSLHQIVWSGSKDATFEFENVTLTLLNHIMHAQKESKYTFGRKKVFHYDGHQFNDIGTVSSLAIEKYQDILNNTWSYMPYLSASNEFGVLFIGTTDKKLVRSFADNLVKEQVEKLIKHKKN